MDIITIGWKVLNLPSIIDIKINELIMKVWYESLSTISKILYTLYIEKISFFNVDWVSNRWLENMRENKSSKVVNGVADKDAIPECYKAGPISSIYVMQNEVTKLS